MELYGREAECEFVAHAGGGLVLISGDSGIGKSEFLRRLWQPATDLQVSARPIVVRGVRGSLQNAIASALGDCLHQYTEVVDQPAQVVWDSVKKVLTRLASIGGRQVGEMVLGRAFEFVEAKLGKDAAKAIRAVLAEVLKPLEEGLEDQLATLRAPDLASDLAAIGDLVAGHLGIRIVILLDAGERLAPDDRALLAELATDLDERIKVIVAVNSSDPSGADVERRLLARDIRPITLLPLSAEALARWLEEEGIPRKQWSAIDRLSSGYPLFVEDAVQLIQRGVSLAEVAVPASFEALLDLAWSSLGDAEQLVAARLAGFMDPPSDEFLCGYLQLDELQLGVIKGRLSQHRVFVHRSDGSTWFHERRRAFIWEHLLDGGQRAVASKSAIAALQAWTANRNGIESWVASSVPGFVRNLGSTEREPELDKLLSIERDQLALLWAVLELAEPSQAESRFPDTNQVVLYAYERAGLDSDPLLALERLHDLGLIALASNEAASVVGLVAPSNIYFACLLGEIEHRFFVQPIPHIATSAFNAFIRSPLGRFDRASISVGSGSLANHRNALEDLSRARDGWRPISETIGLGLDTQVDGHTVTVTVLFEREEDRTEAVTQLAQRSGEGTRLLLLKATNLPPERSRHSRYTRLLADLQLDRSDVSVPDIADLVRNLDLRARARQVITEQMTGEEVSALRMKSGSRFLLQSLREPGSWVEYEISGGESQRTVVLPLDFDETLARDPLAEAKLRSAGFLSGNERLNHWSTRYSKSRKTPHPLREEIESISARGVAFNRGLGRVRLRLDEDALADAILREREARRRLRTSLAKAGLCPASSAEQHSLYIVIDQHSATERGMAMWGARTLSVADGQGDVRVAVDAHDGASMSEADSTTLLRLWGIRDESLVRGRGAGFATSVLAPLLGYSDEDVTLFDPRQPEVS